MKKHTMLGVNENKCCILECLIGFNNLDINDLTEDDFVHNSTNWNGCDEIERTLTLKGYKPTGHRIALKEPVIFRGSDSDCGNQYPWRFDVNEIWELEE